MTTSDPRPPLWIGHVRLETRRLDDSHDFMLAIGMRPIVKGDGFAVLELRGGTHLVLAETDAPADAIAGFDLMVEDLDAAHGDLIEKGFAPSEIARGKIHDSFTVQDPGGVAIKFNSTHVSEHPV